MSSRETPLARVSRTTGQEVLFLLALAFAGAFVWWWYQAWSVLFPAESLLSAVGIFKLMISLVYGVVVPLFWSMLLPNSPTGSYLQKQTWAQPGQIAVFVFAVVLSYFGFGTMWTWLNSVAPDLYTTGMFWPAIAAAMVGSTFVPAMQFAYQTPGQQMLLIQQAHEIRKLRKLHDGEIAVIEGRMIRAAVLASMRWADMLPADHAEAYHTMRALFMGIADTQRRIARVQGVGADVQRALGIPEDAEIAEQIDRVQAWLEAPADHIERTYDYVEDAPPPPALSRGAPAERMPDLRGSHQDAAPAPRDAGRERAGNDAPQRPAAPRSAPQRYAAEYAGARESLADERIWNVRRLAEALGGMSERSARERMDAWAARGLVRSAETKGMYYFTEWDEQQQWAEEREVQR